MIQLIFKYKAILSGLPWCIVKSPLANAVDMGLIPGSRRFPGEGNSNPFQYSCLENSMDRGAWAGYSPWGHKESDMTEVTFTSLVDVCRRKAWVSIFPFNYPF